VNRIPSLQWHGDYRNQKSPASSFALARLGTERKKKTAWTIDPSEAANILGANWKDLGRARLRAMPQTPVEFRKGTELREIRRDICLGRIADVDGQEALRRTWQESTATLHSLSTGESEEKAPPAEDCGKMAGQSIMFRSDALLGFLRSETDRFRTPLSGKFPDCAPSR